MKCLHCGGEAGVLETRSKSGGVVICRRRQCKGCNLRFSTFEINERLYSTIRKHMGPHAVGVRNKWALKERNTEIVRRVLAGEKRYLLAKEYGLSGESVSTITVKGGIPSRSRPNRSQEKT